MLNMIAGFHAQEISAAVAAFLASIVEFVEALTIILAVGVTRGWRPALLGGLCGAVLLMGLVALFGPALQLVPLDQLKFVVGILLILFGIRWLRKAILRSAGILALHDEEKIFKKQSLALTQGHRFKGKLIRDPVAFITAFKAVLIEGLEVVFIVIATGSTRKSMAPAIVGASAAGLLVVLLGILIHKPLARVPENALKFFVGVVILAFGVFWMGESFGYLWPGEDLAIPALALAFYMISWFVIRAIQQPQFTLESRRQE